MFNVDFAHSISGHTPANKSNGLLQEIEKEPSIFNSLKKEIQPPKEPVKKDVTFQRLKEVVYYKNDYTVVAQYDETGKKTREIKRNSDGSIKDISDYEYDANGNWTRCVVRDSEGNVDMYFERKYTSDGHPLKQTGYYADGSPIYVLEYDCNGNIVQKEISDKSGNIIDESD